MSAAGSFVFYTKRPLATFSSFVEKVARGRHLFRGKVTVFWSAVEKHGHFPTLLCLFSMVKVAESEIYWREKILYEQLIQMTLRGLFLVLNVMKLLTKEKRR